MFWNIFRNPPLKLKSLDVPVNEKVWIMYLDGRTELPWLWSNRTSYEIKKQWENNLIRNKARVSVEKHRCDFYLDSGQAGQVAATSTHWIRHITREASQGRFTIHHIFNYLSIKIFKIIGIIKLIYFTSVLEAGRWKRSPTLGPGSRLYYTSIFIHLLSLANQYKNPKASEVLQMRKK